MKLKRQITFIFLLTSLFCEAQYDIKWQKTIGGSDIDQLNSVTQSPDGGFVLGGTSQSNISGDKTENINGSLEYWVVKIDSLGNLVWQNTIGGSDLDLICSIIPSPDGGCFGGEFIFKHLW